MPEPLIPDQLLDTRPRRPMLPIRPVGDGVTTRACISLAVCPTCTQAQCAHNKHTEDRQSGAFPTARGRRRYLLLTAVLVALAGLFTLGLLAWDNPLPFGTDGFWRIAELRVTSIAVIAVVALCQGVATIAFQTVTHNRIITPSIIGFESLYTVIQTAAVFFFGIAGIVAIQGVPQFLAQVALMVLFSALLYGWLLGGRFGDLHTMLLIGIILGGGLGALSTFMRRLLSPAEFDVLTARLIGSVANADATYLVVALPLVVGATAGLWLVARKLDVLALGEAAALNLGVPHRRYLILVLLLVAVLMAVSTTLVGPMAFLGFLIAMLTYQLADTHDHRYLFPMSWLIGYVVLTGAYFTLKHIFYAQGAVGIIIEVVGGAFFLIHLLRKGRL